MYLTKVLLSVPKTKIVMVLLRSTGSNHTLRSFREKNAEKKEIIFFDPYIQMECVYKEEMKIRSMKHPMKITKTYNEDTYGIIPKHLLKYDVAPEKTKTKNSKEKSEKSKRS